MVCSDRITGPVSLPQYGFSTDIEFDKLIETNHFLFRVYTPKAPSPFADDTEPIFVAPKFNERFVRSPAEFTRTPVGFSDDRRHIGTYEDVAIHMDWSTKSASPYISTSFSFIWSIWEALRRYHSGVKKDIEIAVIDASAVSNRAATAVQLLQAGSSRREEHWKWHRYAQESQSVLVYEYIPRSAVLASVPLGSLLEKLPSYFLRRGAISESSKSSLGSVGWDYSEKKQSYRKFCQDMSNRFLQSTPETQLEDTTAGSVRLALAFLRPWFHRCVVDDFQAASITLCALSFNIAQWPGQWWAQEHSELWNLIRAMVLSLAEEIREAEGNRNNKEIVRLQGVIVGLEGAVEDYKAEIKARNAIKPARLLTPLLIPPPLRPITRHIPPFPSSTTKPVDSSESQPSVAKVVMKTPITPPTSPIRVGQVRYFPSETLSSSPTRSSSVGSTQESLTGSSQSSILSTLPTISQTPASSDTPSDVSFSIVPPSSVEPPETPISPTTPTVIPPKDVAKVDASNVIDDDDDEEEELEELEEELELSTCTEPVESTRRQRIIVRTKSSTMAETATCVVTGFLVGAFITLCLMSPQRRTLLTHLT